MNLFSQFIATEFDGSQAQAAAALEVDPSLVSRIARGERRVSPALAQKIHDLTRGKYARERFVWPGSEGDLDPDAGRIVPMTEMP